jgi:hypothetical protein
MDWIPVVFITFKLLVIGAAMFFSIKSHRDKQQEEQEEERQRQARAVATGSAIPLGQPAHDAAPGETANPDLFRAQ